MKLSSLLRSATALVSLTFLLPLIARAQSDDGKLRIIVFGAHPDDAQYTSGGTAAKWAKLGHHVKLVSVTNGDIGHWESAGGPLAQRRLAEVKKADALIGAETQVLDIHDGELMPSLENRQKIIRIIREWRADIVRGTIIPTTATSAYSFRMRPSWSQCHSCAAMCHL